MPSSEDIHKWGFVIFKKIRIDALLRILKKANITPNEISLITLGSGIAMALFCFVNYKLFLLAFIVNFIADAIDGYYARNFWKPTNLGEFLDHGGDTFVTLLLLIKSCFYLNPWLAGISITLFALHSILGIYKRTIREDLPVRTFVYIFPFQLYNFALAVNIIKQTIILIRNYSRSK